jgi:hypothetical protein
MSQRINPDPTKEISEYQKYKEDRAPLSSQTVTKEDKAPLISPVNKTQTVTIVLSKVQKVVMLIIAEKEALEAKTAKDPV